LKEVLTAKPSGSWWLRAHESWPQQGPLNAPSYRCQNILTEIIELFSQIVSSACSDETILLNDETIFRFRADIRKQPLVIQLPTKRAQRLD
jgi:hypothetical protein